MTARMSHCPGCGKPLGRVHRCTGRRPAPKPSEAPLEGLARAQAIARVRAAIRQGPPPVQPVLGDGTQWPGEGQ